MVSVDYSKPMKRVAFFEAMNVLLHTDIRRVAILTGLRRVSCLDKAIRARAINQLAEATGIDRDQIYEMFADAILIS